MLHFMIHEMRNEIKDDITEERLEIAAKMFIYLNFCPNDFIISEKKEKFTFLIKSLSLKEIILYLNRIRITAKDNYKIVAHKTLEKLREILPLQYRNLQMLLSSEEKFHENWKDNKDLMSLEGMVKSTSFRILKL